MGDLPSDPALLRQTVMTLSSRLAALSAECSTLSAERDAAIAQRDAAVQENDKLLMILSQYKRTIFGPRSETLVPGQLSLFITAQAAGAVANDDVTGGKLPDGADGRGKRPARRSRGKLQEHLPSIDVVIDIESHICPCCGERLHKIGETVKEAYDVIPMQYRQSGLGKAIRGDPPMTLTFDQQRRLGAGEIRRKVIRLQTHEASESDFPVGSIAECYPTRVGRKVS
ncbi:hypothetical protein ACVWXO_000489 [Bradyrhizobium sp. LM2.7]